MVADLVTLLLTAIRCGASRCWPRFRRILDSRLFIFSLFQLSQQKAVAVSKWFKTAVLEVAIRFFLFLPCVDSRNSGLLRASHESKIIVPFKDLLVKFKPLSVVNFAVTVRIISVEKAF